MASSHNGMFVTRWYEGQKQVKSALDLNLMNRKGRTSWKTVSVMYTLVSSSIYRMSPVGVHVWCLRSTALQIMRAVMSSIYIRNGKKLNIQPKQFKWIHDPRKQTANSSDVNVGQLAFSLSALYILSCIYNRKQLECHCGHWWGTSVSTRDSGLFL